MNSGEHNYASKRQIPPHVWKEVIEINVHISKKKEVRSQRFLILKVNWVGCQTKRRSLNSFEQNVSAVAAISGYSKKISSRGKSEVNLFNPTSKFTHIKFRAIDWRHSTPSGLSVRGNACALHLNSRAITADYQCKQQASLLGDNTAEKVQWVHLPNGMTGEAIDVRVLSFQDYL